MKKKVLALILALTLVLSLMTPLSTMVYAGDEICINGNWDNATARRNVTMCRDNGESLQVPGEVYRWFEAGGAGWEGWYWPVYNVVIDLESEYVLTKYEFGYLDNSISPYEYEFYGSKTNNGADWVLLASETGNMASPGKAFDSNTGYRFIRFRILNANNDNEWIRIHQVKIFGVESAAPCTVTFDSNGGSAVAPIPTFDNAIITEPTPPTNGALIFLGWYKDALFTQKYNFSDKVLGDMTLYAKWTNAIYTVTFNSMDGSSVAAQQIPEGELANEPVCTKSEYDLLGWYLNGALYNFNAPVTQNLVLVAEWKLAGSLIPPIGPITSGNSWDEANVNNPRILERYFSNGDTSWKLRYWFDGIKGSIPQNDPWVAISNGDFFVYDLENAYNLTKTIIYSNTGWAPTSFKIEGTNNYTGGTTTWEDIVTITGNTKSGVPILFDVDTNAFRYIKFTFLTVPGEWPNVSELEFYGKPGAPVVNYGGTISSVTANGSAYDVAYSISLKEAETAVCVLGLYDAKGILLSAKAVASSSTSASIETTGTAASAKLFIWQDLSTIKPLYNAAKWPSQ